MTRLLEKPEFLSVGEVALLLRVSPGSIYKAVERGTLPALRLAPEGSIRIPADALTVGGGARAHDRPSASAGGVEPVVPARGEESP